ncbi:phosphoribosylglycinamide formyltransferase [Ceratobasidium sp. AG-Ba]|nr:phosphoribosylglycinamide formyltransferase [Ceratobasidium sp. AG-Ba]
MDLQQSENAAQTIQKTRKIVVLISGSGSNLQALMDACASSRIPSAQIAFVLSNRSAAYGLQRAAQANPPIPTAVLAYKTYVNARAREGAQVGREDYDVAVAERILKAVPDADLIVLAGWMHILSERFLDAIHPIPIINLHPALPGAFDGANALQRAFEAFQKGEIAHTGVMVHRVIKEVDQGEPILTRVVEIKKEDTLADLEARVHEVEHDLLVEAVVKVLQEKAM